MCGSTTAIAYSVRRNWKTQFTIHRHTTRKLGISNIISNASTISFKFDYRCAMELHCFVHGSIRVAISLKFYSCRAMYLSTYCTRTHEQCSTSHIKCKHQFLLHRSSLSQFLFYFLLLFSFAVFEFRSNYAAHFYAANVCSTEAMVRIRC